MKFTYRFNPENIILGTRIKPQVDANGAKIILQKTYGIKVIEICELNSYDDKNFLVFADK